MLPRVFTNSLYFDENLIENFKFIEITAFIWIPHVIYALILWLWLKKESIGLFARESLQGSMGKDVLYDTMNREYLNWRKYHEQIAYKTVQTFKMPGKKAFVVDDSIAYFALL